MKTNTLKRFNTITTVLAFIGMIHTAPTMANSINFELTNMVDSNEILPLSTEVITSFGDIAVDQDGTIAFRSLQSNSFSGIYTAKNGVITKITDENDTVPAKAEDPTEQFTSFDGNVQIAAGLVLFHGTPNNNSAREIMIIDDGKRKQVVLQEGVTLESGGMLIDDIEDSEGYGFDGRAVVVAANDGDFLLRFQHGKLKTVGDLSTVAPASLGGTLSDYDDGFPDKHGQRIVYYAEANGIRGIFINKRQSHSTRSILLKGDTIPGTSRIVNSFGDPAIDGGNVAVGVRDIDGEKSIHFYNDKTKVLKTVLTEGDLLPGGSIFTDYNDVGVSGQTVIAHINTDQGYMVIAWHKGVLTEIIMEGDNFNGKIVDRISNFARHSVNGRFFGFGVKTLDGVNALYRGKFWVEE